MKAKSLSFAFIYFSESGLFKGLRAIQIKKSGHVPGFVQNVSSAIPHPFLLGAVGQAACLIPELEKSIARISALCKTLRVFLINARRRGGRDSPVAPPGNRGRRRPAI
jgi:hypothetical protein